MTTHSGVAMWKIEPGVRARDWVRQMGQAMGQAMDQAFISQMVPLSTSANDTHSR